MSLTAKQEGFAQSIADGMTQADAYRANYSTAKMSDHVLYVKASELMSDGKVSVRVQELREALAEKALWKREDSVKALKTIAVDDRDAPSAAKVSAVKELNAMHGYNEPQKHDVNVKGITRIEREIVRPKNTNR